jgi:HEAT repeat protein
LGLDDSVFDVREAVALALAKSDDRRCVPVLVSVLESFERSGLIAAYALGDLKAREAILPLGRRYAMATEKWDREGYLSALKKIDPMEADRLLDPIYEESLKKPSSNPDNIGPVLGISLGAAVMIGGLPTQPVSRRTFLCPWQWANVFNASRHNSNALNSAGTAIVTV